MAKLILQNQTEPASPDAGCSTIYIDSTDDLMKIKDSNGCVRGLIDTNNFTITGCGAPTECPSIIGQTYINTETAGGIWVAKSTNCRCRVGGTGTMVFLGGLGGGGGGGYGSGCPKSMSGAVRGYGGGGGAGGTYKECFISINTDKICVIVGEGGLGGNGQTNTLPSAGGDSCFGTIVFEGGSGGNSGGACTGGNNGCYSGGAVARGAGGGGAGAGGNGCASYFSCCGNASGGEGGKGVNVFGLFCTGGGGGGGAQKGSQRNAGTCMPYGYDGGGCGYSATGSGRTGDGTSATCYGGGGGGATGPECGGNGCQGVVVVLYPIFCNYNITGGTITCCNGCKIHTFTSNGFLCVLPNN